MTYGAQSAGTFKVDWDGTNDSGGKVADGNYYVKVNYTNKSDGSNGITTIGAYPIESLKIDSGIAYFKVGSKYMPVSSVKEIY
jgi:flagellar basal-body rod modification protein FlgD